MKKISGFIIALLLVGTLWATSIPSSQDPIISVRKPGGSTNFNGTATLFITDTSSSAGNANNCSADTIDLVMCGITDSGGNATLGTGVFANVTGTNIFQLGYWFSIPQGTFSTDESSIFRDIVAQDGQRVILQGTSEQSIPPESEVCSGSCPEFDTFFAEVLVPKGGTLAVQVTSNKTSLDALNAPPLPEPTTFTLLSGGIVALLFLRRRASRTLRV